MKTVRRFLFLVVVGLVTHNSYAQFSAGLDLGVPVSTFSNMASTGVGGSLRFDGAISDKVGWTVSAGYLSFSGKTYYDNVNKVSIPFGTTSNTPISGGIKYYFSEANKGFYGGVDLSINFLSTYVYTINSGNGGGYNLQTSSQSIFGFNPGIGYRITNWDFSGRYNALGDFSYLGIRVAYVFESK